MRLGGTVCCSNPAEWEEKLAASGFRAVTAPFTCETPRAETERLLEATAAAAAENINKLLEQERGNRSHGQEGSRKADTRN